MKENRKKSARVGGEVISFVPDLFRHLSSQASAIFLGIPVQGVEERTGCPVLWVQQPGKAGQFKPTGDREVTEWSCSFGSP